MADIKIETWRAVILATKITIKCAQITLYKTLTYQLLSENTKKKNPNTTVKQLPF